MCGERGTSDGDMAATPASDGLAKEAAPSADDDNASLGGCGTMDSTRRADGETRCAAPADAEDDSEDADDNAVEPASGRIGLVCRASAGAVAWSAGDVDAG